MSTLTIFTAPKPFTDPHINIIQRNAIRNWLSLGEQVDVILIGDEEGMAEVAEEYGVKHLPQVATNEWGTPLVSSIFELGREHSHSPLLMYLNADILILPEMLDTALKVKKQSDQFLLIGQRWDLDVTELLDFSDGWDQRLKDDLMARGSMHNPTGSDYFLYTRTVFESIPEFAIGRAGWDNWMIYHAIEQPWPCIDGTSSVNIVHQNHDYSHLPGGKTHYDLEETDINVRLAGGERNMCMVLDAEKELVDNKIRAPRFRMERFVRKLERITHPEHHTGFRWWLLQRLRRWRKAVIRRKQNA